MDGCLTTSLSKFASKLEAWNKNTFSNTFKRKKRNLSRLERMQRAMEGRLSEGLLELEMKLKGERKKILLQEELLWKQKS